MFGANIKMMIIAVVLSFAVTVVLGKFTIPVLRRIKAGQSIREDGPQSHLQKAGTPTMGGIFMIAAVIITSIILAVVFGRGDAAFLNDMFSTTSVGVQTAVLLLSILAFGAVGFLDDFIKVVLKRNLGLNGKQKMGLLVIFGIILAIYQINTSPVGSKVFIPFINIDVNFGLLYVPFIVFVVAAMTNSVNLTDGLDGLASSVTVPVVLFLGITAAGIHYGIVGIFMGAVAGACLGFLVYNHNPAKVFMGDTGSLALGGAISAAAILMDRTLILPIMGFVYVAEALSVIIQVTVYKKTGKRVFKMSPIHHHFELSGWGEKKVVAVFALASLILCIIGAVIIW